MRPASNLIRSPSLAHGLLHLPRDLCHTLRSIYLVKPPEPPVVDHQRLRLLLVGLQPRGDNLFPVVRALLELSTIVIAAKVGLRWAFVNIVNLAAHLTHPPSGDTPQQQRRIDREINDDRALVSVLPQ